MQKAKAMRKWDLRDNSGEVLVPAVEATVGEIQLAIAAADATQPQNAPHYATDAATGERLVSETNIRPSLVDSVDE